MNKTVFKVADKETNNCVIDVFSTYEEAEKCIWQNEEEDKVNGNYVADYYQIIEGVEESETCDCETCSHYTFTL